MTVNKAKVLKFKRAGIYVRSSVCFHGRLYVSFSRSSSFDNVAVAVIERASTG